MLKVLLKTDRELWSAISKFMRKRHITPCTVKCLSNNCFSNSSYYEDFLSLLTQLNGQIYTKLLTIRYIMNVFIIPSMLIMSKMTLTNWNLAKVMDLIALHLIISLMHLLCVLCMYHIYLLPCYIIVLPQKPYVFPLWSSYQHAQTNTSDIKNYKRITLSTLLYKVLGCCIISSNSVVLRSIQCVPWLLKWSITIAIMVALSMCVCSMHPKPLIGLIY